MPKISPWLLGSLLFTSPLLAQPPLTTPAASSALPQAESRRLYFAVPPEQLAGHSLLTAQVVLEGRPWIRETFDLGRTTVTGAVFELLTGRPDLRSHLAQLAADRTLRAELLVSLDDQVVRKFDALQGFLRASRRLERGGATSQAAASTVLDMTGSGLQSIAARGYYPDPACLQQCAENDADCRINDGGCASFGECDRCNNDYYHCLGFCPLLCSDPKSVRVISDVTTNKGTFASGNTACYSNSLFLYREVKTWFQRTRTTRTEFCNGTYQDQTEVVQDTFYVCWQQTQSQCGYYGSSPVPGCQWE